MHTISAFDLGWFLPDGRPLFQNLNFHLGPQRIGLIGPNGCGKSTLLKILAGRIPPGSGSISIQGSLSMVPQDVESFREGDVAAALGVAGLWKAWCRVRDSSARAEDMDTLQDQWDLEERCTSVLSRSGLPHLNPGKSCQCLSGGELLRVVIAGTVLRGADFLVLDEPTNHLDTSSRAALAEVVAGWKGGVIIASHDRNLLRSMDCIAEMSGEELRLHGGNYDFYRRAVEIEQAAAESTVAAGEAAFRKDKRARQQTLERQSKRSSRGAKGAADQGLPKIVLGMRKRNAQESSAKLEKVHGERVEKSRQKLIQARRCLREKVAIQIDAADTVVHASKLLLQVKGVNLRFADGSWLWQTPLDLEIRGPERVGLQGDNGSGKSLLLAMIRGKITPSTGYIRMHTSRLGLLDQTVSFLKPNHSVFENLRDHAKPDVSDSELRVRLGRFNFPAQTALKPVAVLSGGERMRVGLACLLASGREMDLLLLDEPTNNLDLASLEALESTLDTYRGAMIVVSHDRDFRKHLAFDRSLQL